MATTLPLVESGRLKALAIGGAQRSPAMPNTPTIAETIPGFESTSWQGFFVPAGTPREIVAHLQRETAKVLKLPDVMERLRAGGNEGVAFAVPSATVRSIVSQILTTGKVAHAYLGVEVQSVPAQAASALGLHVGAEVTGPSTLREALPSLP